MKLTTLPSGKTIATIDGDTHIGKWAIEAGRLDHDQNTLPLLAPYIRYGGTVVDAGAYIGDHTVFYADYVGPQGRVIAFEPNIEAFQCLHHNVQGLQVTCHHAGLSSAASNAKVVKSANGGASFLTEGNGVPVIALDMLNLQELHFFKLDIEGWEMEALKGARATIARCRPVMLIEVNEHALQRQGASVAELLAYVDALGYTYRNIYDHEPMEGPQFDILCKPRP